MTVRLSTGFRPHSKTPSSLYLRLSLTEGCNLKCRYCRPQTADRCNVDLRPLSDANLLSLVSRIHEVVPIRKIRFTGGEPLLKPGLENLIRTYRQALPDAEYCLTTNGLLLEKNVQALKRAGIRFLNISLDTIDETTFYELTRVRGLSRVMQGIAAAHQAGFEKLKLNTVLMRHCNSDQVPGLVRVAARHGCEIRFVELMPFGEGAKIFNEEFFSADETLERIQKSFRFIKEDSPSSTARRLRFEVDGREVVVGFITPVSHPFCRSCDRIRLDNFGRMFTCLKAEESLRLGEALCRESEETMKQRIHTAISSRNGPHAQWPSRSMVQLGG